MFAPNQLVECNIFRAEAHLLPFRATAEVDPPRPAIIAKHLKASRRTDDPATNILSFATFYLAAIAKVSCRSYL